MWNYSRTSASKVRAKNSPLSLEASTPGTADLLVERSRKRMGSNTRRRSSQRSSKTLRGKINRHTAKKPPCSVYPIAAMCRLKFAPMKKYICILASAALLAACEQKTETTEPMRTPLSKSPPPAASSPASATDSSAAGTVESPAATTESPAQSPPGS